MTKEEKKQRLEELKDKASELKKEIDYYNALQLALKLVLNGSYGALATSYFVLFNNHVAGTITAQGRDLTKTMSEVNQDYWYNQWHLDFELHKKLGIRDVTPLDKSIEEPSIYADTDSVFVSFEFAIEHSTWKDIIFDNLDKLSKPHIILAGRNQILTKNTNCLGCVNNLEEFEKLLSLNYSYIVVDGFWVKNRDFRKLLKEKNISDDMIKWNWSYELDYIQGIDYYRYADYFVNRLNEYASKFGVANKQDFELERISESVINVAKKKYIQHIVYEDGIPFDRLTYIFPKGVELVRSSTPYFAREKIVDIVKYLFSNPDTFNIKDLLKLVKNLRREFELVDIDDIAMQSSVSNYETKVKDDKEKLEFETGTHFAVKASAYHNYLLHRRKDLQSKYEFVKSGTKIKYYYCKNRSINDMFAYIRGSFPIEIAPEIDYDIQFMKCILSPINSIIEPLGMPEITKRLSVVMDIFGGELNNKESEKDDYDLEDDWVDVSFS
jgi:DNA polymerase elongation subunit (family B)